MLILNLASKHSFRLDRLTLFNETFFFISLGNLRKDYVSERFVIVNPPVPQKPKTKKNPYKAGNETMTNPSVLSLVQKDGMLQRLQDDEGDCVKNWSVRVFPATNPSVLSLVQ